jgi:long-chain fatty acid transport protein
MSTGRFLTLVLLILLSLSAQASGFLSSLLGQRQLGMGLAGTGLALDASAIYYNPAALAFIPRRVSLLFGGTAAQPVTRYAGLDLSSNRSRTLSPTQTPFYVHASWKGKRNSRWASVAFGLSVTTPFSTATQWPDDWKGRFIAQEFIINALYVQPAISFRFGKKKNLGLGLSGIYAAGNLSIRKAIPSDGPNNTEGSVQFSGTGTGLGFSAGLYYRLSPRLSLGLTYRHAPQIEVDSGRARFIVPVSLQSNYPNQRFYSRVKLPPQLSLGVAYQPQDRLLLSFEVQWVGWQRFDSLSIHLSKPVRNLPLYPARAFRSVVNFRMGGEYQASEKLRISAGAYYDTSPVPTTKLSPDLPDSNAIGLTAGLGIKLVSTLMLELSYAYEYTGERTAHFEAAGFRGVYRSNQHTIGAGLSFSL